MGRARQRSAQFLALALGLSPLAGSMGCSGEAFTGPGGGGPMGGAWGSSMLASSRSLDTLAPAERSDLCEELRALVEEDVDSDLYREVRCTVAAWNGSNNAPEATRATECQRLYQECLTTSTDRLSDVVMCMEVVALDASCANVGQLRNCYGAWGPAIQQAYDDVLRVQPRNCVEAFNAGGVSASPMSAEASVPQSCIQLAQSCQ